MEREFENIVFDWGGILIDIDFRKVEKALRDLGVSNEAYHDREVSEILIRMEKGLYSESEFLEILRLRCNRPVSDEELRDAYCCILEDYPLWKMQMLMELRKRYKVYLLSNTNSLHWKFSLERDYRPRGIKPEDCFDMLFLSNLIHSLKPEAEIYEYMIAHSGLDPKKTLYIEDLPQNQAAGEKFGFKVCRLATNSLKKESCILGDGRFRIGEFII